MEPNQVHVVTAAVFRSLEQVVDAREARLTRQIMSDVFETHRHDRVHHDLPVVHAVVTALLDVGPRPDANAAPDPSPSNSLAKSAGKHHDA